MGKAKQLLERMNAGELNNADANGSLAGKLFAEWRQDQAMAKERHETGLEPARRTLEFKPPKAQGRKAPARSRIKERDIPF